MPQPSRTPRSVPASLSTGGTRFIGRASELADLAAAIRDAGARLVTIHGPPGTGKTRLGLRFAELEHARGDWPGGVWLVDLAGANSSDEACALIGNALGVSFDAESDADAQLRLALAARGRALVLLDNFEQLVEVAALAVDGWLSAAEEAHFIVTSRERLRTKHERALELSPMAVPGGSDLTPAVALEFEAIQLLVEVADGFELGPQNLEAAIGIVRELDGIPLAIELAARRLPLLGAAPLLSRMHLRLDLLNRAPRGTSARQATLRGAFDWSWDLLDERERSALLACAVFSGGVALESFAAVLGSDSELDAVSLLESLRDKSLISLAQGGTGVARFFLYQSILMYLREKLAQSERSHELSLRHARYFADTARQRRRELCGPGAEAALQWLSDELDNLRSAHAAALDMDLELAAELALGAEPVLSRRGPPQLLTRFIEPVRSAPDFAALSAELRAELERAGGVAWRRKGDTAASLDALKRAAVAAENAGLAELAAEIDVEAALSAQANGQLDVAHRYYENALQRLPGSADQRVGSRARAGLGLLCHSQGRLDDAAEHYNAALNMALSAEDGALAFSVHKDLGTLRLQQRRSDEAREHYRRALSLPKALHDPATEGVIEGNLGILEQEQGNLERAREHYERALSFFRNSGARLYEAHLVGYLGGLLHEQGMLSGACEHYGDALRILEPIGDRRQLGVFEAARAAAEAQRGRCEAAEEGFARARAHLERVGDPGPLLALRLHALQLRRARRQAADNPAEESDRLWRELSEIQQLESRALAASDDARFALRLLTASRRETSLSYDPRTHVLRLPGAPEIELGARAPLRRIVEALLEQRQRAPGSALGPSDLLSAGWPGERMTPPAAANRLKVALSTLRKLGLRELLLRSEDGYLLDPSLPVEPVEPTGS